MNIKQIAKAAGVSVATVSRVLNHPENVAPKTREKIQKIIDEEEYTPNLLAQGLNFKRTKTIGLVLPQNINLVSGAPRTQYLEIVAYKILFALFQKTEKSSPVRLIAGNRRPFGNQKRRQPIGIQKLTVFLAVFAVIRIFAGWEMKILPVTPPDTGGHFPKGSDIAVSLHQLFAVGRSVLAGYQRVVHSGVGSVEISHRQFKKLRLDLVLSRRVGKILSLNQASGQYHKNKTKIPYQKHLGTCMLLTVSGSESRTSSDPPSPLPFSVIPRHAFPHGRDSSETPETIIKKQVSGRPEKHLTL